MDSLSSSNLDLTKLSDRDKQELQQFVVNESQKARIQGCMCPSSLKFSLSPHKPLSPSTFPSENGH